MTTMISTPYKMEYAKNIYTYMSKLINMLEEYALRRDFGDSCFIDKHPAWNTGGRYRNDGNKVVYLCRRLPKGVVHFGGNFFRYSFAFSVYTDDPQIIAQLTEAIEKNQARENYQVQDSPERFDDSVIEIHGKPIDNWAENPAAAFKVFA